MRNGNTFFLKSFQINIIPKQNLKNKSKPEYKSSSVLSSGSWYKLGVNEDGFYKIDKLFLESIGLDIQSINPKNIKIYGRPAGMLPEENYVFRIDDL